MNLHVVMRNLVTLLMAVGALQALWAQAQPPVPAKVWRCGQLFTNQPQPGQVCELWASVPATVVEGTRVNAGSVAAPPPTGGAASSGAAGQPAPPAANPASAQQARMLLQAELREQEERWQQLQRQWNQGQPLGTLQQPEGSAAYRERVTALREQLHRTEADLAALRRELARLP
ncbi:MAG: hypothetical protein RJA69_1777 [Pseudomonadota bacterium]|jgi:hypothetical protein